MTKDKKLIIYIKAIICFCFVYIIGLVEFMFSNSESLMPGLLYADVFISLIFGFIFLLLWDRDFAYWFATF